MADIRPFRAFRPAPGLEKEVAALPYDVYNRTEARAEVEGNPYSFLAVDRAETQFEDGCDPYSDQVYEKAGSLLSEWIREGRFVQESRPAYFIYELEMDGRKQTGIVACASVDDYLNQVIRRHENTRQEKEMDRIRHVDACCAQTGPIFLAYRSNGQINEVTDRVRQTPCLFEFTAPDGIIHRGWRIDGNEDIMLLQQAFSRVETAYIADGHHRCASAVKVAQRRRQEKPGYTGQEPFNYFLSVLFPDDQLLIMDYNRVVKDLNGLTQEELLDKIGESFEVEPMPWLEETKGEKSEEGEWTGTGLRRSRPCRPDRKGCFGLLLGGRWYRLTVRKSILTDDPVEGLDVSILQNHLLGPVLGIRDPRTDKRIDFVGGIRGLEELERRCGQDCAAAFSLYPTSIEELFAVADAGLLMPPKSTWFEPKLRSGLFIHSLLEEDYNAACAAE